MIHNKNKIAMFSLKFKVQTLNAKFQGKIIFEGIPQSFCKITSDECIRNNF